MEENGNTAIEMEGGLQYEGIPSTGECVTIGSRLQMNSVDKIHARDSNSKELLKTKSFGAVIYIRMVKV